MKRFSAFLMHFPPGNNRDVGSTAILSAFPAHPFRESEQFCHEIVALSPGQQKKDCAFIDINGDPDFPIWLIRHGLAIPTGVTQRSGFCEYPEYRFRTERLQELDPDGYAEYRQSLEGRHTA